jgi:peptidoglycan/xylan/chitin deacetylase (PgdA/CDA1 family)
MRLLLAVACVLLLAGCARGVPTSVSTKAGSRRTPGLAADQTRPPGGKLVALTFDDGPDPHYTPSILAVLDSAGVKATFFEIGQMVEAHPQIASSVANDGMLIGDHTESHPDLAKMNDQQVTRQIEVCAGNILRFTGVRPH